ncbi:DNA polymerase alpha subunit B isoform X1 [Phascolarctos cinereus]|uniref:DNA polymerase alpha subunit B n=1 Tax=Phascolarctos cinereus TaxID=38626 RepID=A0A6P5IXS3_PHACI|nr:DNA polymerase alpha subunit B [Phascolarctos cinereus]
MGPGGAGSVSAERLASELQMFGLDCEEAAYEKLVELCPLYRKTEDELVAELVAFSTNTGKVYLTLENLSSFESEFLTKRIARARHGTTKKDSGHPGTWDIVSIQELIEVEAKEETLLNSYTTPSKGSQKRSVSTPETPQSKRNVSAACSPHLLFSPASFSPSATPSQKYSSRSSRGEVVTTFGSTQGMSWSGKGGGGSLSVKVLDAAKALTGNYKCMFQKLTDVREVLTCRIEELGHELKELHHIEAFSPVSVPVQEPITLLGQIGCDSNGKLNPKSVILEGDREHSLGVQIPVDLSELREYSLFPGQVVVMEGANSTGKKFIATKLYEGVPLPFYQPTEEDGDSDQRMILVACGPYTTSDNVTYDPMMDLIDVIRRDQPDVCILLGPFLDAKHEQVENCQLTSTFENVFKSCLRTILEGTRSSGTHLVFVPSLRDVHHQPVYPQPPFSFPELPKEDIKRVHFVSDPCNLSINGVILGLTSTDLLLHMGAEEITSSSSASDRFSRILKHVLTQRSYYPLYPPFEEMSIDYEHFYSHAQLPITPDVFIIPSDLRYFVKDILGCVCMNPGRLTKGQVGGTFGRLYISRQAADGSGRRSPCTAAQVVKI